MLTFQIITDSAVRVLNAVLKGLDARRIAHAVAEGVVRPALRVYPNASRKKQPFVSAKQRAYFFAALNDGRIQVPYRRTSALGENWTETPFTSGVTLTSDQPYSDLVRTKGKQSAYHQGHWHHTERIAKDSEDAAERVATAEIVAIIHEAGAGP
jgi:hypothetical protein